MTLCRYHPLGRLMNSGVPLLGGGGVSAPRIISSGGSSMHGVGCFRALVLNVGVSKSQHLQVRLASNRGRQQTTQHHVSPYGRIPFFHERGPGIGIDKSLQERLEELFSIDPDLSERVDIGFMKKKQSKGSGRGSTLEWRQKIRSDRELEKAAREGTLTVDMNQVKEEWINSNEVFEDIFAAAELYGVYEDLYKQGYFHPCLLLDIAFRGDDDIAAPVYRGNIIKPLEARETPEVSWRSGDDELWCLVMTSLDTHFTIEGGEYVHWMVTNIQGGDISTGKELVSYLPPFPPYGTGYHRFVFVMYRQHKVLDLPKYQLQSGPTSLNERTFSTFNFYSELQDDLTPAGLAFFQSDYDSSLRDFFHNVLNMREPRFEYEFPEPYIKSWDSFYPLNQSKGFNEFLDRHRDPKDIEKEVLENKLKHTHPFLGDTDDYIQYPGAHEGELLETFCQPIGEKKQLNPNQSRKIAQWRRNQIQKERLKQGYYGTTDHHQLRRDPSWNS